MTTAVGQLELRFTAPVELVAALRQRAADADRTVSAEIRRALRGYLHADQRGLGDTLSSAAAWAPVSDRSRFFEDLKALVGFERAEVIERVCAENLGGIPHIAEELVASLRHFASPGASTPPQVAPQGPTGISDERGAPASPSGIKDVSSPSVTSDPAPSSPAAGTVPHPSTIGLTSVEEVLSVMRAAGCICEDPSEAGVNKAAANPMCPIEGHATPVNESALRAIYG